MPCGHQPRGRDARAAGSSAPWGAGGWSTLTVGTPPPARAITATDGSPVGLLSRCTVQAGTCTKSPGAGVEHAVEALELEPQDPRHDVQAGLVALVVVPPRHRAGRRRDPAGPEDGTSKASSRAIPGVGSAASRSPALITRTASAMAPACHAARARTTARLRRRRARVETSRSTATATGARRGTSPPPPTTSPPTRAAVRGDGARLRRHPRLRAAAVRRAVRGRRRRRAALRLPRLRHLRRRAAAGRRPPPPPRGLPRRRRRGARPPGRRPRPDRALGHLLLRRPRRRRGRARPPGPRTDQPGRRDGRRSVPWPSPSATAGSAARPGWPPRAARRGARS